MERVVVMMEYPNINRPAADKGVTVEYGALLSYLTADRFLVEAFCYMPIDPRNRTGRDREIENLRRQGWLVETKIGRASESSYKCNFDVEITLALMQVAERVKPDIIVLASGDIDFIPVVDELRKRGIRVEAASFPNSMSRDLILRASGFIDLDLWLNDLVASLEQEATIEQAG